MSTETNPYAEVIRILATEFTPGITSHEVATLTYAGLNELTKQALIHVDPKMAAGVTALRHILDSFSTLTDGDELVAFAWAVRCGIDAWLEGAGDQETSA